MSRYLFIIIALLMAGCAKSVELGPAPVESTYLEDLEEFYANRHHSLTNEVGWMRLAGMYWLEHGPNSFGSSPNNNVVFPDGYIPDYVGSFIVSDTSVVMSVLADVEITVTDSVVTEVDMLANDDDDPIRARYKTLEWLVIKRGDLLGVRLYNSYNPKVDEFDGFPRYETNTDFYVLAELVTEDVPETVRIANILGQEEDLISPGTLRFEINDEEFSLVTIQGGERMFIIVGDETNKDQTYQAGRYIYVDMPEDGSNLTMIDFNKMYNPPCAFSPYTTCQLPPVQNRLGIRIEAGEKRPTQSYLLE